MVTRFDKDAIQDWHKMTKNIAALVTYNSLYGRNWVSVILLLQEFKSTSDARKIHHSSARWSFDQYQIDAIKGAVGATLKHSNCTSFHDDDILIFSSA